MRKSTQAIIIALLSSRHISAIAVPRKWKNTIKMSFIDPTRFYIDSISVYCITLRNTETNMLIDGVINLNDLDGSQLFEVQCAVENLLYAKKLNLY